MNFLESMIVDDILTASDKQLIIKHALDTIMAQENEKKFPGQDQAELYHGQSIIQAALYEEFIINMYSLHDKEFLKKMGPTWYKSYKHQPIDQIRNYFGESIAMYFSFVGAFDSHKMFSNNFFIKKYFSAFYTFALMVPTIFGIFQFLFASVTTPFFCVFYVLWMTMFLEIWKRKSSELAFKWGTITMTNLGNYFDYLFKETINLS